MISLQKLFGKTDVFYDLLERSAKEAQNSVHLLKNLLSKPAGSQNLDSLKEQAAFSGWLMTIARNRCLNEIRKHKRHVVVSATDVFSEDDGDREVILVADSDHAALHFEHSLVLLRQLIEMHEGEPRATVARMFYLDEKPVKDIAEALDMNQNTVLSHLRRFRLVVSQAMVQLIEEKGIEIN